MTDAIAYRGPDGDGHLVDADAGIALGHRRLAIIDLSPTGFQPMTSADGRVVITYNGELYNRAEMASELAMRFRGTSDTEVLVEAIQALAAPLKNPVCLAGERACPPEDCGGAPGYENLLDVLRDRTHPEHRDMLAWAGRGFNPERFDLAAVNRKLKLLK